MSVYTELEIKPAHLTDAVCPVINLASAQFNALARLDN